MALGHNWQFLSISATIDYSGASSDDKQTKNNKMHEHLTNKERGFVCHQLSLAKIFKQTLKNILVVSIPEARTHIDNCSFQLPALLCFPEVSSKWLLTPHQMISSMLGVSPWWHYDAHIDVCSFCFLRSLLKEVATRNSRLLLPTAQRATESYLAEVTRLIQQHILSL